MTNGRSIADSTAVPARNAPCPCASGLRYKRCCGLNDTQAPGPAQVVAHAERHGLARADLDHGRLDDAARRCIGILDELPTHPHALRLLARIRDTQGLRGCAETLLTRVLRITPFDVWSLCRLGFWLYERRELPAAQEHARNAVRIDPDSAAAHNLLGMIFNDYGDLRAAEHHYRRTLALHGSQANVCANLALVLTAQGRLDEAATCYAQADELAPNDPNTLIAWARQAVLADDTAAALERIERAQSLHGDRAACAAVRSALHRRAGRHVEALAVLDALGTADEISSARFHFTRGEALDRLGHYDDAFAAFDRANALTRELPMRRFDEARSIEFMQRLRAFFERARVERLPRATPGSHESARPIFVVGFPRSGTTLTEQMLAGHPQISAGGELSLIAELTRLAPAWLGSPLPYPECLVDLWFGDNVNTLARFREYYIDGARHLGASTDGLPWFTDKMPLNEIHLGLIHLVFPDAPVVHLVRHPLDVVLSCYFNDFTHGNNQAYRLDTAARHFARSRELVDHYLHELDLRYLPVHYESLIAEPESQCRQILEFIGLDWDPGCLRFHDIDRYAHTASYAQVREPLYTRSVHRYRNYRSALDDIIPILEPTIEKLGYRID